MIHTFEKENNGAWYIVLPHWPGMKGSLAMVAGADKMLDRLLSFGESRVTLELKTSRVEEDEWQILTRVQKRHALLGGGADYRELDGNQIWLCNVTKFVFGEFPKHISFKILEPDYSIEQVKETMFDRAYQTIQPYLFD